MLSLSYGISGVFDKQRAEHYINEGIFYILAFSHIFLANQDLIVRLKNDYPLADAERQYFYSGYIDFSHIWIPLS